MRVGPSPRWMRQRLRNCGVRPINNLVDITNYVMLEYGQPMHCFDYQYVNGGRIRCAAPARASASSRWTVPTAPSAPEMLIIADDAGPIGVAGVMGGIQRHLRAHHLGGVRERHVQRPQRAHHRQKLGLRTEASSRYEKGPGPQHLQQGFGPRAGAWCSCWTRVTW